MLERFFMKLRDLEPNGWENELSAWNEQSSEELKNMAAVVKATLPAFYRAFARDDNPLEGAATLQAEKHLHAFIHPIHSSMLRTRIQPGDQSRRPPHSRKF
ncbi:hypothetical protein HDU90_002550 [Geranomyces variabilis]|nr:hypothetical protein HDU90_002550 [Geranomyces variabilis]